jgi:20S proteasome subunit alpha 4
MSRYDRAITVFSPDGHLFQVDYALEAVRKGALAVAVRGRDSVVIGVERKATAVLQDSRTIRKIVNIDDHICLGFAGLTADARVLVNRARIEAQSFKLMLDEKVDLEYMTRFIAGIQQKYTHSGGVRPFGVATLLLGYNHDGLPKLYQTDPSGTYAAWKATAIGRNSKAVREYLETNYTETTEDGTIKLVLQALMESLEISSDTIELGVLGKRQGLRIIDETRLGELVKVLEDQKTITDGARKMASCTSKPAK